MAGTGGSFMQSGGLYLPTPRVLVSPRGTAAGDHDRVSVGWMGQAEWDALSETQPEVWLFRYKRGYSPSRLPHTGGTHDHDRGWRHPSDTTLSANPNKRSYSGGGHNSRQGGVIPVRASEWLVSGPNLYVADFQPELWFLDPGANPYAWPIAPLASAGPFDYGLIGKSGQSSTDTGADPNFTQRPIRSASQLRGTQTQYFAFAFAVRDSADPRNRIVGPMTPKIRCDIWPKVQSHYACPTFADRGRKVRVRHV